MRSLMELIILGTSISYPLFISLEALFATTTAVYEEHK